MLSFSYTTSLQLRGLLARGDELRATILTLPTSSKTETKLQWEAIAIRIWATLALSGEELPKHQIATLLAHPSRPSAVLRTLFGQRDAYRWIHDLWRANPKPITTGTLEMLCFVLYGKTQRTRSLFESMEGAISEALDYLSAQEEHPIIQSAIIHIHLLTIPALADDHGVFARVVSYLFLAKYGYDVRGYIAPEQSWHETSPTYNHLTDAYIKKPTLTVWLNFITESYISTLERAYQNITTNRFHIEFPASFWALSDRQKEVLKMLETPDESITNRKVQKQFRVSQITASRDLTKLVTLGLLYPHGKGRSVYYTKI